MSIFICSQINKQTKNLSDFSTNFKNQPRQIRELFVSFDVTKIRQLHRRMPVLGDAFMTSDSRVTMSVTSIQVAQYYLER